MALKDILKRKKKAPEPKPVKESELIEAEIEGDEEEKNGLALHLSHP